MRGGQGYAGTAESLPAAHLVRSLGISHYTIGTPTAPRWTHSPSRFGLCSNYPCFSFYGPLLFSFWSTESRTGKTLWYSCSHRRSSLDDKAEDKLSGGARPRGAHHCTLISLFSVASFLFSIALLRNCVSASRRRAGEREQTRTTRRGGFKRAGTQPRLPVACASTPAAVVPPDKTDLRCVFSRSMASLSFSLSFVFF